MEGVLFYTKENDRIVITPTGSENEEDAQTVHPQLEEIKTFRVQIISNC